MKKYINLIVLILVFTAISGCAQKRLYKQRQFLLGTVVEVVSPYPEAPGIALKEIDRVESIFSIFIEDSPVSHLNKTGFLNTNFEVCSLLKEAKKFYKLSGGKFDVTIAPLTKIWKKAISEKKLPDDAEIKQNLKLVGFDKVYIDKKNNSVKFNVKGMQVDLGAIAKGYAVDAAIKELKRKGIDSAIVNAGGDMYCLGSRFDKPWKVGIQHPRKKGTVSTLEIRDMAVVTSGDYEQFIIKDGKRFSHIIDPKTGYPIENNVISVTVVAKDAITADAVATSVFLLGKEKGMEVFKNYDGVKKIIVITQGDEQNN